LIEVKHSETLVRVRRRKSENPSLYPFHKMLVHGNYFDVATKDIVHTRNSLRSLCNRYSKKRTDGLRYAIETHRAQGFIRVWLYDPRLE
jgi:hypothetical protein